MASSNVPNIVQRLLADDGRRIRPYFHIPTTPARDSRIWDRVSKVENAQKPEKWISAFGRKIENRILDHTMNHG